MSNAERNPAQDAIDPRFGRANPLFSSVVRLVPNSGLQFIDLAIPTRSLAGTLSKFLKDDDPERGALLIRLADDARVDGYDLHPVTRRPLTPADTLWLTGYQGLEPFLGTWVPLPYLRFLGRKDVGQTRFDKGPSNWARIYIEPPREGLRNAETLRAVLAFDTQVDSRSRVEQDVYLAPNSDDVFFGPVFMLAPDADEIADFLGETWLDDWLSAALDRYRGPVAATGPGASERSLEHLARYLTLLKVLGSDAELPQVRFVNTTAGHWQARTFGVDLLLDIDESETAAVILDRRSTPASPQRMARVEPLQLRDLSRPTELHAGPFATTAEFAAPYFGDTAASRRSGRNDAFFWPSLVRIGAEGQRISLRPSATPGLTGLAGVVRGLAETGVTPGVWRFSRADDGAEPGAMVAGELLEHIAEDGSVLGPGCDGKSPAIRPRFSRSSMLSMFVAECILHSLAQLNAPAALAETGEVRELSRIVVTCPHLASADERRLMLGRVEEAVELIWSARGWNDATTGLVPERPQVSLGIDPALSAQLLYLFDEVRGHYAGNARQFASVLRQCRRDDASRPGEIGDDELRIATLDIAGAGTSLSLVGYGIASDGTIEPRAIDGARTRIGGASLDEAVLRSEILPAIIRALGAAGHPDGAGLVARVTGAAAEDARQVPVHLPSRLLAKALNRAAASFMAIYHELPQGATTAGAGIMSLGRLVERGQGRLDPSAAAFDAIAVSEGARGFRLADVPVRIRVRSVAKTIGEQLDPLIERVAAMIRAHDVDVLLLSGRHGGLPDVRRLLLKHLPIGPHRIVDIAARWPSVVVELAGSGFERMGPRALPLLGAAFGGGRGPMAMDRFSRLADLLADAVVDRPADDLPQPDARTLALMRLAWAGTSEAARIESRHGAQSHRGGAP